MASLPGLEPGTYCLEGSCSVQLSYRDKLAIQLPKLHTIHPKKTPRPTETTQDFFAFIVTPPSCLNKFTALIRSSRDWLELRERNGREDVKPGRMQTKRSQGLDWTIVASSVLPPTQFHGHRAISYVPAMKDTAQLPVSRTFPCDSSPSGAPVHGLRHSQPRAPVP